MAKPHEAEVTVNAIAAFRPETASPEDVEKLIDVRVAQIDEQLQQHAAAADALRAERKRWLGVTGGRSRVLPTEETPA